MKKPYLNLKSVLRTQRKQIIFDSEGKELDNEGALHHHRRGTYASKRGEQKEWGSLPFPVFLLA